MPEWKTGDRVVVTEHDDATRQPKPGGAAYPGVVESTPGIYVNVRTDSGSRMSFYQDSGWHAWDGAFRWRILPPGNGEATGPEWVEGMACRVVEHDPVTRQPKPGGAVLPAELRGVADYLHVFLLGNGPDAFGGVRGAFQRDGWLAWKDFRWRLVPGVDVASAADGNEHLKILLGQIQADLAGLREALSGALDRIRVLEGRQQEKED